VHIKIICHARACNNFEFTFQLMTVSLLNTKGFHIRRKGLLEHLEAFLYPTVHEISCVWFVVKLQIPTVSGSMHVERCDCLISIVHNVRREMLLPVPKHIRNLQWQHLIMDQRYCWVPMAQGGL